MARRATKPAKISEPKLLDYLDGLIDHLRRLVPKAIRGNHADSIHQSRVATRRLKAAIDLLDPILEEKRVKPFARSLRKLRRRLGPLRDFDVMRGHLNELRKSADQTRISAIDWLAMRFDLGRREALKRAQKKSASNKMLAKLGAWWGLREQIVGADETIESLLRESTKKQFADFSKTADGLVNQTASERVDPHAIRIAGKSLRYTLEMQKAHSSTVGSGAQKIFKRMQDALGLWHDYIVLTERMLSCSSEAKLAHHDAPTQRAILALSQVTLKKSEKHLHHFAVLWQGHRAELFEVIDPKSPDPKSPATESQTGRDPSGSAEIPSPAAPASDVPQVA